MGGICGYRLRLVRLTSFHLRAGLNVTLNAAGGDLTLRLHEEALPVVLDEDQVRRPRRRRTAYIAAPIALVAFVVFIAAVLVHRHQASTAAVQASQPLAGSSPAQRWLIPGATPVPQPGPAPSLLPPSAPPQAHDVPDGPVASALSSILAPLAPVAALRRDYVKDVTDAEGNTIAKLRYVSPTGGALTVVRQQLQKPIPVFSITLGRTNAKDSITADGTEVVTLDEPSSGFSQQVAVSATGTMTTVTSSGIPGKSVPQPLSLAEVIAVATHLTR